MLNSNLKQVMTYGFGSIAQSALGFLLVPLYLRFLSPSEYGVIAVLLTMVSVFSLVAGAGVLSGVSRLYYQLINNERRAMAGTVIVWMFISALTLSLIIWILAEPISVMLFTSPLYGFEIRSSALIVLLATFQASLNSVMRLEKRAEGFVVVSTIGFLSDLFFKVYLIVWMERGIDGYLISSITSQALMGIASIVIIRRDFILTFQLPLLRDTLVLGFPYIFSGLAMWVVEVSDRLILNMFVGPNMVGVYALANKFASIFNVILLTPLSLFWTPFVFSYAAERGDNAMREALSRAFILLMLIGSCVLIAICGGVSDIIGIFSGYELYNDAVILAPFLSLAPFLYMMCHIAGTAILQSKKVKYSSYAMLLAATLNVALNLIFIPQFALYGVTAATVVSYIVLFGFMFFWAQRLFYVPYDWIRCIKIAICTLIAIVTVSLIKIDDPIISLLLKESIGMISFGVALLITGSLDVLNVQFMRTVIKNVYTRFL